MASALRPDKFTHVFDHVGQFELRGRNIGNVPILGIDRAIPASNSKNEISGFPVVCNPHSGTRGDESSRCFKADISRTRCVVTVAIPGIVAMDVSSRTGNNSLLNIEPLYGLRIDSK